MNRRIAKKILHAAVRTKAWCRRPGPRHTRRMVLAACDRLYGGDWHAWRAALLHLRLAPTPRLLRQEWRAMAPIWALTPTPEARRERLAYRWRRLWP